MSVRIQLDKAHDCYTNLDFISGRAVLYLNAPDAISGIVVKLEGESSTRLADENNRRRGPELEIHKILYKTQEVFPSEEIKQQTGGRSAYTLPAGQHEYPFRFKIPFNNNCLPSNSFLNSVRFGPGRVEIARDPEKHVKKTLPPSLTALPGEAEVKYYVKVTVARPGFYKLNPKQILDFKFLPIEPPRPPVNNQETYARRKHEFQSIEGSLKKKGLFESFKKPEVPKPVSIETIGISVDARLPNPPILTCNRPLPLRIILHKLTQEYEESLFLASLHIELIGYTHVRVHEMGRRESASWIVQSFANLSVPLGEPKATSGSDIVLEESLWDSITLPSSVAPTFETCNIARTYELEVRVGIGYGSLKTFRNNTIILPLRSKVQVFSGIPPPQALLDAIAARTGEGAPSLAAPDMLSPSAGGMIPPSPMSASPAYPGAANFGAPAPQQAFAEPMGEAPPSYEDAMAEDIAPVDGMRATYDTATQQHSTGDTKQIIDPPSDGAQPSSSSTPTERVQAPNAQRQNTIPRKAPPGG